MSLTKPITKKVKSKKFIGVYYNPLQDGDRSYYITYKDFYGKKKWLKIGKHNEGIRENFCYNKRAEILNKIKLGENPTVVKNKRVLKEAITFKMIAEDYIKFKKLRLSNRSMADIKSKYKHMKPFLDNKIIEDITTDDIDEIVFDKEDILAPKTINMITELVGTIFNFAIEHGKFKQKNPAKKCYKLSVDNNRETFLSKDDIKLLIDRTKEENTQAYLFTILALSTGGRIQTICNIQKKHIKLDTKTIILKDFKNKKTYTGFIKKEFIDIIRTHIEKLSPNDYILGKGDIVKQVQRKLRPILNELFNNQLNSNDRKNRVVIHSLRHTFASQLISNNVPIFVVQRLMNHADIKTTMRYVTVDSYFGQEFVDDLF